MQGVKLVYHHGPVSRISGNGNSSKAILLLESPDNHQTCIMHPAIVMELESMMWRVGLGAIAVGLRKE